MSIRGILNRNPEISPNDLDFIIYGNVIQGIVSCGGYDVLWGMCGGYCTCPIDGRRCAKILTLLPYSFLTPILALVLIKHFCL